MFMRTAFTRLNRRSLVVELYQGLLGRYPDERGLEHHANLLKNGESLATLARGLVASDEFKKRQTGNGYEQEPDGCLRSEAMEVFQQFEDRERKSKPGFVTNFMGGVVDVRFIDWLAAMSGAVEGYPIPANIHGYTIEWLGTLRSVLDAKTSYSIVELGAGWAPWCAVGYVAAKKMGIKDISLIAVEGDRGKIPFIRDNFEAHGIDESATTIKYGVVGPRDGVAEFPDLSVDANVNYGMAAKFDKCENAKTIQVPAFTLETILATSGCIDLLHCDVQGAELDTFRQGMEVAKKKIKRVVISTHSHEIDKELIGLFNGWICEGITSSEFIVPSILQKDGCQIWRNPLLTSQG